MSQELKIDDTLTTNAVDIFKEACVVDTFDYASHLKHIKKIGLSSIPVEIAKEYPWGVLGNDIYGWYDQDQTNVLIFQIQGKISSDAIKLYKNGGYGFSQPVKRNEAIPHVIDSSGRPLSGAVLCSIFGRTKSKYELYTNMREMEFYASKLKQPDRVFNRTGVGRKFGKYQEGYLWRRKKQNDDFFVNLLIDVNPDENGYYGFEISGSYGLSVERNEF